MDLKSIKKESKRAADTYSWQVEKKKKLIVQISTKTP